MGKEIYGDIIYRSITEKDLIEIANIHISSFKGYFLTELGNPLLNMYYREFFIENPDLFIVAENSKGKLVGFAMGMLEKSQARRNFESKYKKQLFLKLLLMCLLLNKNAWPRVINKAKQIFNSRFKSKKTPAVSSASKSEKGEIYGSLLSIAALPEYAGKGIGKKLIGGYEELLIAQKCKKCYLTVRESNHYARKFYDVCGYNIVEQASDEVKYCKTLNDYKDI